MLAASGSRSAGSRGPPATSSPRSPFYFLFVFATLLTLAFFSCSYWLGGPSMPTDGVIGGPSRSSGSGEEGPHSRTLAAARSLGTSTEAPRAGGPLGGPYLPPGGPPRDGVLSASQSHERVVLFPTPTIGLPASTPFSFDAMKALSAPPLAMSFVDSSSVMAPVELYAVKHACTHTLNHPGLKRDRSSYADPPFVQGLQATARDRLLESSGLYRQSYIREVTLKVDRDHDLIREIHLKTERVFFSFDEHFNEGVATYYSVGLERLLLLLLTWKAGLVYVIDYETFGCIGSLNAGNLEGWGFVSSLDLTLYTDYQNAKAEAEAEASAAASSREQSALHAAAAAANSREQATVHASSAAAVAEVARRRLLRHAQQQQLWMTTGGPELIEVSVQPIENALAANLSSIYAAIRQEEREQQQRRYHRQPFKVSQPTPRCRKQLGKLEIERTSFVHCLGQVLVGLNELEYNKERHTIVANLYGLPVLVEIHPDSGACQSLISLSGVAVVEKHHDEYHRVMNAVAIPYDTFGDPLYLTSSGGPPGVPALFIAGKEWPSIALVQLRRLRVGDTQEVETRDSYNAHLCEEAEQSEEEFMQVHSFSELKKQLPRFLFTGKMKRWRR